MKNDHQTNTPSFEIVPGFFTKTTAKEKATVRRARAKNEGREGAKVVVEDAYMFYVRNAWFRKKVTGKLPQPGQYAVVIYYKPTDDDQQQTALSTTTTKVIEIKPQPKTTTVGKSAAQLLASSLPVHSSNRRATRFSPAFLIEEINMAANQVLSKVIDLYTTQLMVA